MTLTKKQKEYVDSIDVHQKTIRLKDGRVMSLETFKVWWHESVILPKRKANLEAILRTRGRCHKVAIQNLRQLKTQTSLTFGAITVMWHDKETLCHIRLNAHADINHHVNPLVDVTLPCQSLDAFEKISQTVKQFTVWFCENANTRIQPQVIMETELT